MKNYFNITFLSIVQLELERSNHRLGSEFDRLSGFSLMEKIIIALCFNLHEALATRMTTGKKTPAQISIHLNFNHRRILQQPSIKKRLISEPTIFLGIVILLRLLASIILTICICLSLCSLLISSLFIFNISICTFF